MDFKDSILAMSIAVFVYWIFLNIGNIPGISFDVLPFAVLIVLIALCVLGGLVKHTDEKFESVK